MGLEILCKPISAGLFFPLAWCWPSLPLSPLSLLRFSVCIRLDHSLPLSTSLPHPGKTPAFWPTGQGLAVSQDPSQSLTSSGKSSLTAWDTFLWFLCHFVFRPCRVPPFVYIFSFPCSSYKSPILKGRKEGCRHSIPSTESSFSRGSVEIWRRRRKRRKEEEGRIMRERRKK